jgi:hypothetical protein
MLNEAMESGDTNIPNPPRTLVFPRSFSGLQASRNED